jgi:transposase
MNTTRKAYPSDVSGADWEFLLPYLALMTEDAPQRGHDLREVFHAVRYVVRSGCPRRMLPNDLPDWAVAYQQARRWMAAGVLEALAHDLRVILRLVGERGPHPTATIPDGRAMQSTPESGGRAGSDGAKKKNGSKVHVAGDTLGNLLAVKVTAANDQERAQVAGPAARVQEVTGRTVEVAFVDHGYTGEDAASQAAAHGIRLEVVKHTEAKKGFVLLPRRWVVERTCGWLGRFRRPTRDYERLADTLAGWHWLASVLLLLGKVGFTSQ